MRRHLHLLAALALLATSGLLRQPFLHQLVLSFRQQQLLAQPLNISVTEQIGQTSSAIALGGLRSFVASFTNLRTYEYFTQTRWADIEKSANLTVQLAPHDRYYWDIGAWHLGVNASGYYASDSNLPPIRARAERNRWIRKGREFLENGTRYNPDNPLMFWSLGRLYGDPFRDPDDVKATQAYLRATQLGADLPHMRRTLVYSMARSKDHPQELRKRLKELLQSHENRLPTILCIQFALLAQDQPNLSRYDLAIKIFGSEERALRLLSNYFVDIRERLPLDGVEVAIRLIEAKHHIHPDSPQSAIYQRNAYLQQQHLFEQR